MADPIVYGPAYSTYVRTVRLALEEKGVPYKLVELDFLSDPAKTGGAEHRARHPWGKVPAFEHDGFSLYETAAVTRYVDEAFDGPALQPGDARGRARMQQLIGILDSYTYGPAIQKVAIQRLIVPMKGGTPDEQAIGEAMPAVTTAVTEIARLLGKSQFLAGDALSLADLHAVPIFAYFTMTPDSKPLMEKNAGLKGWWERISGRKSVGKTAPSFG